MNNANHPVVLISNDRLAEMARWMDTETPEDELNRYLRKSLPRIRETLRRVPLATDNSCHLLDVGCYGVMIPWYVDLLGYRKISAIAYEPRFHLNDNIRKTGGETGFQLNTHFLNVEENPWPIDDETVDQVLCMELLEHMATDPMHLMEEMNRVMKTGATLILTTPNSASWRALSRCMLGEQPYSWTAFYGIPGLVNRHNREYTPSEVATLMHDAGMTVTELATFEKVNAGALRTLISRIGGLPGMLTGRCPSSMRREKILVVARKDTPVRNRWPRWLYKDPDQLADRIARAGERGQRRLKNR